MTVNASALADIGLHVFDLHDVRDGVCTCGKPQCASPGKHPLRQGAFAYQKHDPSHTGNLGVATGKVSDLFVVDIDPRNGGTEGWAALCARNGGEPITLEVATGGGGRHLYFAWPPNGDVRCSSSVLAPGVDVKGTGGYVVAPGSSHVSGGTYRWANAEGIEAAPPWILALVTQPERPTAAPAPDFPPASPAVLAAAEQNVTDWRESNPTAAGTGHNDAVAVAAFLRSSWGLTYEEALPIAQRHNELTFNPRSAEELETILRSPPDNSGGDKRQVFDLMQGVRAARKKAEGADAPPSPPQQTEFSRELLRARLERSKHALVHRALAGKALISKSHGGARAPGGKVGAWRTILTEVSNAIAGEAWPAEMVWDVLEVSWLAEGDPPEDPRIHREDLEVELAALRESAPARIEAAEVAIDAYRLECAQRILNLPGDPHDDGDWLAPHLGSKGEPSASHASAIVADALRYSSRWQGFRYDTFTQRFFYRGEEIDSDEAATQLRVWLSVRGLPEARQLKDVLRMVGNENAFDSLRDYYEALPEWDGVDRLGVADRIYLDVDGAGLFTREAVRRWFLSLAARAYVPGIQVDTALILLGTKQGERKSTFFASLPFYLDFRFGRTEDEDTRNLIGRHVVEFSELASLRSRDRDHAKNFITKRTDKVRRMRADDSNQIGRRFAFCGTTNLDAFLDDPTGDRRYWPVTVGEIDYLALRRDLPQVLSQARQIWREGEAHCPRDARCPAHRWYIGKDEPDLFQAQIDAALGYKEESQIAQMVHEAILALPPEARPENITTQWVYANVVELGNLRTDKRIQAAVTDALRAMCGPAKRRSLGVVVSRYYRVPEALLRAPQRKNWRAGPPLKVVKGEAP